MSPAQATSTPALSRACTSISSAPPARSVPSPAEPAPPARSLTRDLAARLRCELPRRAPQPLTARTHSRGPRRCDTQTRHPYADQARPRKGAGPMGVGPPRATQRQRAHQVRRRRAQRPGQDREHLRAPRLCLDRPHRPSRADAVVGPLHPTQAGDRRRQDGGARTPRARRRVFHAPHQDRRRPARPPPAADDRGDRHHLRPRHRGRDRPAERPAALDQDRGRPGDLGKAGSGRAAHPGGVR